MPSENKTANIGLNQWQANEYPKREDFNADNLAIDEALGGKLSKTGDGKDVTVTFDEATTRTNVGTGEKLSVLLGKIKKWFSDLTDLAFGKCGSAANQALYTTAGGIVTADKLPVEAGGTGASTADSARTNLGAALRLSGTATLAVASWTGTAAPYSYDLSITGITADDTPHVDRITGTDEAAAKLINEAWALIAGCDVKPQTSAGKVRIYVSKKPTVVIPIMWEVIKS